VSRSSESFRTTLGAIHADGRSGALVALGLGWFFVLGQRFTVPALLPFITQDFPVSNAAAGSAITVLWITYAAVQFPSGALVDRVGERRLLLSSALLSAAALTAYLGSVTFTVFLLASAAFGIGTGIFGPARGTAVIRTFPEYEGFAYGTVLAGGSLGAALLPALAAVLASSIGWRAAIGVTIPGFLLVAVLVWRTIPRGTAAAAATDGGTAVRSTAGRVYEGVTNRGVLLGITGTTLMLFAFQGLTAFLTTYLVDAKGLSEATAGVLFGLLFIVAAVAQSLGGGLSDRYGHRAVLAAFTFVSVVPLVVLPLTSGVLPLAFVAAAMGLRQAAIPVLNSYIVSLLPVDVRGTAWGLLRTGLFAVGSFGSILVGTMADADLFAEAFFFLAGLTALSGLVFLVLPHRDDVETAAASA
jgi:predicted MFS family arabinose efflux permease